MENNAVNVPPSATYERKKAQIFLPGGIFLHGLIVEPSWAKEAMENRFLRGLQTWQSEKSLGLRFSVVMCLNVW